MKLPYHFTFHLTPDIDPKTVVTLTLAMTLKLNRDIDIHNTYLQTENEVARSNHSKVTVLISTKIALKVKGQGQMSVTSNHF